MTRVAQFEINHTQYLNQHGEVVGQLPSWAADHRQLVSAYEAMVHARIFDTRVIALQRTGKLGTYPSCLGEEAVAVAVGLAMRPEDVLVAPYRHHGAFFTRGISCTEILLYWGGDERGMLFEGSPGDFPVAVPIATQAPHAVGAAYAFRYRRESRVAVCVVGDGGTSKGDFYEALNAAAVWELPLVFVVVDNRWAISVPRAIQSRAGTLAQKAVAAGIPGEQADGNDYIASHDRVAAAIENARAGHGPALVELLTYRMGDHTTADDASRYRSEAEVAAQRAFDPVDRLRRHLTTGGAWSDTDEEQLQRRCVEAVEADIQRYLDTPPQPPESMFDYLYERLPRAIQGQRRELAGDADDA